MGILTLLATVEASSLWWKPQIGQSWQWSIGAPPIYNTSALIYDADTDLEFDPKAAHREQKKYAICYINVGSIELDPGARPDYKEYPSEKPDNTMLLTFNTSFPLTESDILDYITFISRESHSNGMAVAFKNNNILLQKYPLTLTSITDFAIVEACYRLNNCDQFQPFIDAGKPVFATEYTDSGSDGGCDAITVDQIVDACNALNKFNFEGIIKSCGLQNEYYACQEYADGVRSVNGTTPPNVWTAVDYCGDCVKKPNPSYSAKYDPHYVKGQGFHTDQFSIFGKPIDASSVRIRVEIYQDWIQWFGLAIGEAMDGADMMVFWTNDDASVTISHRIGVPGHKPPTAFETSCSIACIRTTETGYYGGVQYVTFDWLFDAGGAESGDNNNNNSRSWQFTLQPQTFLYALGHKNPNNHDPTARLTPHAPFNKGTFKTSLISPEANWDPSVAMVLSRTNATNTTSTSDVTFPLPTTFIRNDDDDTNFSSGVKEKMVRAHGVLMIIAWLILCPGGIVVARYFKETELWPESGVTWLRLHVGFMFGGCCLIGLIGFLLVVGACVGTARNQFNVSSRGIHVVLGLLIFILIIIQGLLRFVAERFYSYCRKKTDMSWEMVHRTLGYSIFLAALINIPFGVSLYSTLYTPVSLSMWIAYAIWLTIIAMIFGFFEGRLGPCNENGWLTKWIKSQKTGFERKRCSSARDLCWNVPLVNMRWDCTGNDGDRCAANSFESAATRSPKHERSSTSLPPLQLPRLSHSQHFSTGTSTMAATTLGQNSHASGRAQDDRRGCGSVWESFSGSLNRSTSSFSASAVASHFNNNWASIGTAKSTFGTLGNPTPGSLHTLTLERVPNIRESFSTAGTADHLADPFSISILPPPEAAVAVFLKEANIVTVDRVKSVRIAGDCCRQDGSQYGSRSRETTTSFNGSSNSAAAANDLLRRGSTSRILAAAALEQRERGKYGSGGSRVKLSTITSPTISESGNTRSFINMNMITGSGGDKGQGRNGNLQEFSWFELCKERQDDDDDEDINDEGHYIMSRAPPKTDDVFVDIDGDRNSTMNVNDEETSVVYEVLPSSSALLHAARLSQLQGQTDGEGGSRRSLETLVLGTLLAYRGLVTERGGRD
ncbi:hypothetical protein HDU76_005961 [Blyttiomyces sp. JEL0837]|nr:hypothetical protein HDU76_005961 [Blyttiomyces sp. JEL0837]